MRQIYRREAIMQITINPNLYNTAQMYAERQGRNLNTVIEHYLEWFIRKEEIAEQTTVQQPIEITPRVMRFKRGKPWYVSDEELEKIHQEYLTEKYK